MTRRAIAGVDASTPASRPPAVSVVIPTYNHRQYVLETLESVFAQTFADYEVVVVNDGSPDDTRDLLRPAAEAGRIRYFEQENRGQGAARNRGIAEARGEFIALLDDDDRWTPDKLAWQVACLRENPGAVLAYGDYTRLEPTGELSEWVEKECPSGRVYDLFRRQCWILSPGQTLIRASALERTGGFDPAVWGSDDWELYIRLAAAGEFIYRRALCLHYRVHATNASRRAVQHVRNHFKVVRRHIGWNLPLLIAHQRAAATYFVPNLLRFAHERRTARDFRGALAAYLYALSFRPGLLLHRTFIAPLAGSLLGLPPRSKQEAQTLNANGPEFARLQANVQRVQKQSDEAR